MAVYTQDFGQAVCAQNVNDALNQLFGAGRALGVVQRRRSPAPPPRHADGDDDDRSRSDTTPGNTTTTVPASQRHGRQDLLTQAAAKFAQADAHSKATGDLAAVPASSSARAATWSPQAQAKAAGN